MWVKVETDLPKEGEVVIASNGKCWGQAKFYSGDFWFTDDNSYPTKPVTEWMVPIPSNSEGLGVPKNSGEKKPALRGKQQTHGAIALLKRIKSDYDDGDFHMNISYIEDVNAVLAQQQHA